MSNDATCAIHDEATCWTVPAEFVRLKYFFGQRLGVLDLSDEQGYLIGKQRFHNLRAHGAGVFCGLTAERHIFVPMSTQTTILLLRRGAALDGCGREIVVGWDQCIDVAAWFNQNKDAKGIADWADPGFTGERRLYVCLKYRECPSDPTPAPRDPCGCETTGCEFGRVREGFELSLITATEAQTECLERMRPAGNPGTPAVETGGFDQAVNTMINGLAGGACADPDGDCLCLASFLLEFDAGQVVNLTAPNNTIPQRLSLLSTAALQDGLISTIVATGTDMFLGAGPRISQFRLEGTGALTGSFFWDVQLVTDGMTPTPLAPFPGAPAVPTLRFLEFNDGGAWVDRAAYLAAPVWEPGPPSRYRVDVTIPAADMDADGVRYRLDFELPEATPVVDMMMRPLSPVKFSRHFRLLTVGGTLSRATTLFP